MELHLDFVPCISWGEGMNTVVRGSSFLVLTSLFIDLLCWCSLLCPFWNRRWSLQSDRFSAVWFYSRITLFFCSKSHVINRDTRSSSILRHFWFISHHFCCILHHFCFGYKIRVVQIWSKIILVISDQTALHSVQLPLKIIPNTRSNQSNFPGGKIFKS